MHQLLLADTLKFTKKENSLFLLNVTVVMEKSVLLAAYFKLLL